MKKILIILIVIVGFGFYFKNDLKKIVEDLPILKNKITHRAEGVINAPPPLRSSKDYENAILTRSGVINWTNEQRQLNHLTPLKENFKLNNSAKSKIQDMFARQYFEHIAPTGESVSDLVKTVGYEYIIIGENLALGNFKNDQDLVQAWMDSPGHRANILNSRYKDIGVSVLEGTLDGRTVWLAVQHFGLSAETCPKPNENLKNNLTDIDHQVDIMQAKLQQLKKEIEISRSRGQAEYRQKVNEYNSWVNQYNNLLEELKNLTIQYNGQVKSYNKCLAS